MMNRLHGIIFSYLSNPDLRELTQNRNTCSIPYGGRYRVIDFMLSSMVNAGISDVGMIVHANYQSLLDHVGSGKDWDLSRKHGGLRILPPFGYAGKHENGYRGRMDALAGVRSYLQYIRQDYVVLAGGDVAVNLPLRDIFEAHIRNDADITAVCTTHPMGDPKGSDYFSIGTGGRITDVSVHPSIAQGCESLEVYVLSKELLLSLVDHCAAHNIPSFSVGVLQAMSGQLKICPYIYDGYAARLQSVAGYFARSMELLDPAVRADLFAPERPIRTKDRSDPSTYYGPELQVRPLSGGRRLHHRRRGGKLHPLPRRAGGKGRPGVQLRAHAGHLHPGRRRTEIRHYRQERPGQPGPDAHGAQHLSAGHCEKRNRLTLGGTSSPLDTRSPRRPLGGTMPAIPPSPAPARVVARR